MNKRIEHDGVKSRFTNQGTHTGPIPNGVGFPMTKGGGVVRRLNPANYVRIDGRITYVHEFLSMDELPPFGQQADLFDKDKRWLGEGQHVGLGEWYESETQILGVEFWVPFN
jgi:hypothetical protein